MDCKNLILGAACLLASGTALAENRLGELDLPLLHRIQETTCAGNASIMFVPVSNDVDAYRTTYAVISLRNPAPDSADIVSERERLWLTTNGCNGPRADAIMASGESDSGRVRF
ncbi:hypothetical protein [Hyphomonas johnsonii]|jgi:hypothetical protein|uniref:Lipoprotein n=1 Tax=Hyphomonas johnsonii MHS-2 TaxID=1280950 RepID=A0A059FM29_9PROT|nr:hypothetical protein [Hyphomonas johnsonii]KCZ91714.1 hypothetical protein HJO_11372 [Hyphomonas johnsonii MHS-2]